MPKYRVNFTSGNVYEAVVEAENEEAAYKKAEEVIFERPNHDEFENFIRYCNGPERAGCELADENAEVDELPLTAA